MARQPRLDLRGIPQHVVQRGNDRQACFTAETDYLRYLQELREASSKHDCAIHAYVLMTNHVHLLITPATTGAISRMMQAVGRRYVGSFNARYRRTGTLWEGRFKAALVDTDRYLLTCYRYIELNPVRAHMTDDPADYPWSSYPQQRAGAAHATHHPAQAIHAAGHHTCRTTSRLPRLRSGTRGRETPRRSSTAYPATARMGKQTLSAADRSADPAVGQRPASRETGESIQTSGLNEPDPFVGKPLKRNLKVMKEASKDVTPKEQFMGSLARCKSNDRFIPDFYERFMASSDDVRRRFRFTSFEKQNRMLLKSLILSSAATEGDPKALAELTERAETHDHAHLNIKPELYDLWLESLISTAQEFDSEWSDSIEHAWRKILGFVIHRMITKY